MRPDWKEFLKNTPLYRPYRGMRLLSIPYAYYRAPLHGALSWAFQTTEDSNFTYSLDPLNQDYLASFIAEATGVSRAQVLGYFSELLEDEALRAEIAGIYAEQNIPLERVGIQYGRRLGWYALVRATKPKVTVETGVDRGLGSLVLVSALERNRKEGAPGVYYGTDINPLAGFLLRNRLSDEQRILYGDSIESLKKLREKGTKIDFFLNDSDHSAEYEAAEYEVVEPMLSPGAFLLGDNAHVTDKLLRFAEKSGRRFAFFREKPLDHWYPGGGIGLAFGK